MGVVCFPETKRSTEGKRAPRPLGSRPRRTSIAHPYVLDGLACEQSRQSGSMSAWLKTHIAPLWTSNPFASNAASRTSAVRARASKDARGHPASEASARGTQRATSARQARRRHRAIFQTRRAKETASARECAELELESRAREWLTTEGARVFVHRWTLEVSLFEHDVSQKKIARIDGSRASVRSADDAEPPASSLQNLRLVSLLTSLSRGRPPPAWAPPPRRPRPWAPKLRASPRASPPARAAAAPAWAAPGWAARTS